MNIVACLKEVFTSNPTKRLTVVITLISFLVFCFLVMKLLIDLANEIMDKEELVNSVVDMYKYKRLNQSICTCCMSNVDL